MTTPEPPDRPPPPQDAEEEEATGGGTERRWLVLSGLAAALGLGAVAWVVRGATPEVPVISAAESAAPIAALGPQSAGNTGAEGMGAEGSGEGALDALGLEIPTGFDPPQLSGLNFAQSFAEAAAYRGWRCIRPQVVLFSDARQAIPAVQEGLLRLGYQVSDTPPALGEDQSWVARHADKPALFGSFSSGPEGRGNVSVCLVEP